MPPPAGTGGMATRDALRGLALQFETWDFVGTRERDARRKRESADAVAEALRTFQLCASPKLRREENVDRVLVPVVRNFCARLLARVGRVVDRGVSADVDRVARGVRADIDAARGALGALGDLGEIEFAAAIERRLLSLADDLLAGWKGAEPPIRARAVPRGSSSSPSPSLDRPVDDVNARFATFIADEALSVTTDCAAAVTPALNTRENVHNLMTPRVLGFAQRVVFASGACDELPGEALEAALDACERLAAAAEAAAPRTRAREPEPGFEPARERRDDGGFFGIAALAALATGGARASGEDTTTRDDAREAAASLRRVVRRKLAHLLVTTAPKLRAAAEEATRRAERRRRRASTDERKGSGRRDANRVVDDADRVVDALDAFGSSRVSNPSNAHLDENAKRATFAVSREEALAAVRACATPRECASTLAEGPVRAALAPAPASPSAGTPLAARVVAGDQTAKDWTREPEGFVLRVRRAGVISEIFSEDVGNQREGWTSERICTGPFQAHFTAACGALAEAIRDAGTCRRREKRRAARPASRWMARTRRAEPRDEKYPGVSAQSESADAFDAGSGDAAFDDDDAFDDAAACAAASARVMLASSRTVRGGDALRLVLSLFPGADPNDRDGDGVDDASPAAEAPETTSDPSRHPSWIVHAVDPKEAERVLRPAGPTTTVSVWSEGAEVVARDVFFVARVAPGETEAEPWTAVATKTTQRLAPGGEDGRLTLTSQATGLDPDVTRAVLDAFVRERGETKTVPGRRALDEETRAAVARDAERRV